MTDEQFKGLITALDMLLAEQRKQTARLGRIASVLSWVFYLSLVAGALYLLLSLFR